MSKVNTLKEFLSWRGFGEDEARYWARCFYKYTDCGPWVVFLMRDVAAVTVEHAPVHAKIVEKDGHAVLLNVDELPSKLVSFLGFDAQGLEKKEREWDNYLKLVDDYMANETKMDRCKWPFDIQYRGKRMLTVRLRAMSEDHPAVHREIYYEDIGPKYHWVEHKCGCTSEVWGSHADDYLEEYYRDKDPEPDCDVCNGEGKFRKWEPTGEVVTVDPDLCVGIKFGSIVEGSDVCSGPFEHLFPIDKEAFERDLDYMEKETPFYWVRDNSRWYVLSTPNNEYYLRNTWGEIVWEEKPNPKLRKKVESFINEHFDDIPGEPGMWSAAKRDWEAAKIPGTRSSIHERINDSVF